MSDQGENNQIASKAPNAVIVVCATMIAISLIATVLALSLAGKDTDALFRLINVTFNAVSVLASTGAFLYAGAAAKQSHKAVVQTNGGLDARIAQQVAMEIAKDRDVHSDYTNKETPNG